MGTVAAIPRTREAAAGDNSVLVVALELPASTDEALILVLAEILASRGEALLTEGSVEILDPFVPGHRVLLVVATASATMNEIEASVVGGWSDFTRATTEEELTEVRRRVAATNSGTWSGATGRACRCAAVASGAVEWRTATDLEMAILSVPIEVANATLESVTDWDRLQNTGAGVLPIVEFGEREE